MIENKSIGSKVFDVVNVVILILITLVCILPVWYVLCVSLSSREAVSAGKVALWPVGFNLLSYKKILGEGNFFTSFLVSIKRVVLGTGASMVCILLAAYPLSRTKKQFPKRGIFMWIFVFCMLFNGGTVPWYITMKNYGLMDSIWGLVFGMGLQVFNVILAVNFFKNLPVELEEACFIDGGGPWRNLINLHSFGKTDGGNDLAFYDCSVLERVLSGNGSKYKTKQLSASDIHTADGSNIGLFQYEC